MKKFVHTKDLEHAEWLRYRKLGIGGSDAGAICGLNPYRTAIHVYYDKTSDKIEEIDNEAMRQGREFEEYVAQRFMEATGKKVRRTHYMYQHPKYPFMLADVDRLIVGENAGLECKTASPYMEDKWKDGKIPMSYQIQCYHYMAVLELEVMYLAVLILGKGFQYYRIERDEEIIADLIRIEKDFWENNVLKKVIPTPDGSKVADSVIAECYKEAKKETILLSGFDEKLKRRAELEELMKRMETEKKQIEQELKLYMGYAENAENEHYRISWKSIVSNKVDTTRLKEEKPEIYTEYLKPSVSRRLTVQSVA